jgi:ABC-type antimicrobial peptide transport system permease subunit
MGLEVQSQNDVAEKTNKAMSIIDTTSFAIVGILLLITVISIFNSYLNIVYTRTQKFSLQRVLGVSKLRIISGFVVEAVVVGLIYGLLGYYLGSTLVHYLTINIEELVPVLKGIVIQPIREGLLVQALLASMGFSALSALVPAVFASNINLFKAVRRQ